MNRLADAVTIRAQSSTPKIDRLLIVRLSSMGDILHALPAATALRNTFPEATLGWVIEVLSSTTATAVCPSPMNPGDGGAVVTTLSMPRSDMVMLSLL